MWLIAIAFVLVICHSKNTVFKARLKRFDHGCLLYNLEKLCIILSSLHQFSEIAIAPNSFFMMLRNSINFSKFLFKLLILTWNTENEFSINLYTPCSSPPVRCTLVAFPRIRKLTLLKYSLLKMYCWTVNLKKFSSNTTLDDILLGHFALSKLIILVEDLTRWKRSFEIFLIEHYRW